MKTNQLKAGVILSYGSMLLGYAISLVYTPIMLRLLGQSEYGLYNLVASVVSYLGLLSFGFGGAYMRYYSLYKAKNEQENIAKLNGMFLIVFSFLGGLAIIAGSILILNAEVIFGEKLTVNELTTAKTLMAIMIFNIAFSFPVSIFTSYITAHEQYIFQKLIQILRVVLNPLLVLPVLLMGYKSIGLVVVMTLLTLVTEISNVIFCFRKLKIKFSFRAFDFSLCKEIAVFSSYIFLNMIYDQLTFNIDKLIIGHFWGTVSVAIFGLAAQLNMYYFSLSTAISSVFIPRINSMVAATNNNTELTELFTRIGRIQFIVLSFIGSGLIFFGYPFITMWAGPDYSTAYQILLLLIVPATPALIQNLGIEIQKAKNMHRFRTWVYFFISVCNVCISIPLTKLYGGIGAAVGTAISSLIGSGFIMNWYYHKKIGLDMKFFWTQIVKFVPSLLLSLIVGILIITFVDLYNIIWFLVCFGLYAVIFFVSMWFLGMNQYEKKLIRDPVLKIVKKLV